MQAGQQDDKYMDIMHMLQQSTGTSKGKGTSTSVGIGVSTGEGDQDANYCLTVDGLVRFRDKIYVLNCSDLKKLVLRKFHTKPYSDHLGYQKTLTAVNKFYYCLNPRRKWQNSWLDVYIVSRSSKNVSIQVVYYNL